MTETLRNRFWKKVDKTGKCWNWTAHRTEKGYGQFKLDGADGKVEYAHRVSWMLANREIPRGYFVLHRCDNPRCVNPTHLFTGTAADNTQDMLAKGRNRFVSKLNPSQVQRIKRLLKQGTARKTVSHLFNVSTALIDCIANGHCWKQVTI